MPDITPSKKGKSASDAKKKGSMSLFEGKKKAKPSPGKAASKVLTVVVTWEGTSANPSAVLRPRASMLKNPIMAEKFLEE